MLVIGGFNNNRTVLRHQMKTLRELKTPHVLSSSRPIQFRIEISSSEYFMYFIVRCSQCLQPTVK